MTLLSKEDAILPGRRVSSARPDVPAVSDCAISGSQTHDCTCPSCIFLTALKKPTGVLEGRPGVELYRVGRCFCESVGSISRPLEIVPALDSVRKQCGLRLFAIWIVPHHPEDFSAWKLDETVFYNPQYEYLATAVQRTNLARWPADRYLEPRRFTL